MTDKVEVAAVLQKYEDALTEFLTSVRARDTRSDFPLRQRLLEAIRSRAYRGKFIKELHVADTSDLVRKRLIELFVPALGPHGNVFRYKSAQELADDWKA